MNRLKIIALALLLTGCASSTPVAKPQTQPAPLVLHLVVSNQPEWRIERIFTTKQGAMDYIETYKEAHDYDYQTLVLDDN